MDLLSKGRARGEFERFAAVHAEALLRSAYLMAGDRGEAEDLVQECLLRLARKWPRVRSMDQPGAYARRVLFNLILDGGRRRARRRTELLAAQTTNGRAAAVDATAPLETRADLVRALGGLPPRQRAVLVLRYFADLPAAEVALILDCSQGTVKSSTSRGLERLRQTLDPSAQISTADDASPT
jgi:RNA polymerase sigma-70 factor (sigma-E family)